MSVENIAKIARHMNEALGMGVPISPEALALFCIASELNDINESGLTIRGDVLRSDHPLQGQTFDKVADALIDISQAIRIRG
jgi:hypothetical protein